MSASDDFVSGRPDKPPRGFVYFCEERLGYDRGPRAWLFWVPYLLGAMMLEPMLGQTSGDKTQAISWLPLLGFLVLFPPLWQALLRRIGVWRRRKGSETESSSE